jgi:hypothetical protein
MRKIGIATEAAILEAIDYYAKEVAHLALTGHHHGIEEYREELSLRTHGFYQALLDVIREGGKARMSLRLYSWQPKVRGCRASHR